MIDVNAKNLLITGPPGVGKTTLTKRVCETSGSVRWAGFYTLEIREGGTRVGFQLVTSGGQKSVLSHVDIRSPFRIGKYGIDIDGFETLLETIDFVGPATNLIIIDEIGKMECFSAKFGRLLVGLLDSEVPLVATIAQKGGGLIGTIKRRRDISLIQMTKQNRDSLFDEVAAFVLSNTAI